MFVVQVPSDELTNTRFAMNDLGEFTFDPALPLAMDRFDGQSRLTVTADLATQATDRRRFE